MLSAPGGTVLPEGPTRLRGLSFLDKTEPPPYSDPGFPLFRWASAEAPPCPRACRIPIWSHWLSHWPHLAKCKNNFIPTCLKTAFWKLLLAITIRYNVVLYPHSPLKCYSTITEFTEDGQRERGTWQKLNRRNKKAWILQLPLLGGKPKRASSF